MKLINKLKRHIYAKVAPQKIALFKSLEPLVLGQDRTVSEEAKNMRAKLHEGLRGFPGLDTQYVERFVHVVKQKWSRVSSDSVVYNDLLERTRSVSCDALPPRRWLSLYDAAFSSGLFDLLMPLRHKAIESAKGEEVHRPHRSWVVDLAFRAAIDQGDFVEASRLLARLETFGRYRRRMQMYEFYYRVFSGRELGDESLSRQFLSTDRATQAFRELVEGKRVAVVGPAPTGELTGKEIDEYEIVVRTNYRGGDSVTDTKEFGTRTDISYYNGRDGIHIHTLEDHAFLHELKASVFKYVKYRYQMDLQNQGDARETIRPTFLLNGNPLQGLSVVYDLLHFQPAEVKIFKNNLFLNTNPYHEQYRPYEQGNLGSARGPGAHQKLATFTNHDLISHLLCFQTLKRATRISTDTAFQSVISMDPNEYLRKLASIYGPPR